MVTMTNFEKEILGVVLITVGMYFIWQVIKYKETNDLVTTIRTLMGAICLILVGLVLFFFDIKIV